MSFLAPKPPEPPPPPKITDPEIMAAAQRKAEELRRRRGFRSTIITSPLGDTSSAPTSTPKLGGE